MLYLDHCSISTVIFATASSRDRRGNGGDCVCDGPRIDVGPLMDTLTVVAGPGNPARPPASRKTAQYVPATARKRRAPGRAGSIMRSSALIFFSFLHLAFLVSHHCHIGTLLRITPSVLLRTTVSPRATPCVLVFVSDPTQLIFTPL